MDRNAYGDFVATLAERRIRGGVICEPRCYYDLIRPAPPPTDGVTGAPTLGHAVVFRNGEAYPVKITHMVVSLDYISGAGQPITPDSQGIALAQVGARLVMGDHYYMSAQPIALTAWHNVVTGVDDAAGRSTSTWSFLDRGVPFILATRDVLEVVVGRRDENTVEGDTLATVSFVGHGLRTKRPYLLSSSVSLDSAASVTLDPDDFRNDGDEPIVITAVTANMRAALESGAVSGDARRLLLSIRQIGNGTNAWWMHGPLDGSNSLPNDLMPASLLAASSGYSIVHAFAEPLAWEPGGGLDVVLQYLTGDSSYDLYVNVAMLGHILVP